MIGRFFCVVLILGMLSCASKDQLPESVLSADKMEPLLWDLLRAEQFVTNYVLPKDTSKVARAKGPELYQAILKKHGTTDSLFRLSLAYYKKHPKLLLPILDSIGVYSDLAPTQIGRAHV